MISTWFINNQMNVIKWITNVSLSQFVIESFVIWHGKCMVEFYNCFHVILFHFTSFHEQQVRTAVSLLSFSFYISRERLRWLCLNVNTIPFLPVYFKNFSNFRCFSLSIKTIFIYTCIYLFNRFPQTRDWYFCFFFYKNVGCIL